MPAFESQILVERMPCDSAGVGPVSNFECDSSYNF